MIVFPNSKINLGLHITEKRPDGYHNLETVFYPVPLKDALEIHEWTDATDKKYLLYLSGLPIEGDPENNLIIKAYKILDEVFNLPPVRIDFYKHIPTGAGLGGGSSDAAYMLRLLNQMFELQLSDNQLEEYAAMLGADCAFFIKNIPVFAEGIGNLFSPLSLSLHGYGILIVKPNVFVSTRDAFAKIKPHKPTCSLKEIIKRPVSLWKELMVNDFEESVFPKFPVIEEIKNEIYRSGAIYASMTGSGSSVFGLFEPGVEVPEKISLDGKSFRFILS
ncbi:MAG: 4-(cytidine 5'-diphospho)-2-C-methyl-D-erythritol kinase [Bacteroides sp.]|nr:4-(cytidine 5'-diphospho)-2-C-methyl-D-erythritol kinase [Bacteroides sp.]